ncbi:MAG: hypothetical protein BWY06_02452 [Candidatus Latescibacteria bacterium ADurb.Bin168]|nr:MAG: hypothetical protein BWY06_02452 [Candidatus Latescibacteria bacterium ADurb.Bin168]
MSANGYCFPRAPGFRRCLVAALIVLMVGQVPVGAASRTLPAANGTSIVGPWRYQSLWKALRRGRGVIVGTQSGECICGRFVYGGTTYVEISSEDGLREIPVNSIAYVVNVVDLSHARDGAIVGGLIGFGAGVALSYFTRSQTTAASSASRRAMVLDGDESNDPENGSSTSDPYSDSQSSATTAEDGSSTGADTPSESTAGSDPATGSSGSSTASDPTETGSNTYEDGEASSSGESSGSSAGGGTSPPPTSNSSGSNSSNSNTVVYIGGQGGSSSPRPYNGTDQPSGRSSVSPAARMFFYSVGFSALGTLIGWLIGKRIRNAVPRVDYVLLSPGEAESSGRTPDQYLADKMTSGASGNISESLLPGSSFDSERSAALFDQYAHVGSIVRLHDELSGTITASEAREYRLFPAVRGFTQATIVAYGDSRERQGTELRYFAVVTTMRAGAPLVSLQRLAARDVVRMSTQVRLIRAGILP